MSALSVSVLLLALAPSAVALSPHTVVHRRLYHGRHASKPIACASDSSSSTDSGSKAFNPAALPPREVDSRGFIVPQVGDVVKMPSKWPGEWEVGQVDFVQYVGSRSAYEVDLLPLSSIGGDMYRMPGKKPSLVRTDVGKLGRLLTEYVPERDAYRVDPKDLEPTGGWKPEDPSVTAQGLAEYAELKATILREAAILGAVGALAAVPAFGGDVAFAYGLGAVVGTVYVALLQRETDSMYGGASMSRLVRALVGGRLVLPAVLLAFLASKSLAAKGGGEINLALVPREQFGAAVLGFFSYKAPLLVRQIGTALAELATNEDAQAPVEASMSTGSLGMMAKVARANFKSKQDSAAAQGGKVPPAANLVVICGPSGVGKSTLIARLLAEEPERYGFSVSSTTRAPRAGEADGVDYTFVSEAKFGSMVAAGDFVEWAQVGSHKYGTSVGAVEAVAASGCTCLLDLDVQGVQALVAACEAPERKGALRPFCVWVAAPSLDALRARLRARGTEDSTEVENRIQRAISEIEFSLTARCFDKVVLNDELESAYQELKQAISEATQQA